jgi:hypothetical protein
MCKNDEVNRINKIEFNRLDEAVHFECQCWDDFKWKQGKGLGILDSKTDKMLSDDGHPILKELKDHRLATKLGLRIGAVVALVTNLDIEAGLCNGSQDRVVDFQPHDAWVLRSIRKEAGAMKAHILEDLIMVQLAAYHQLAYPVVEFDAAHGRPSTRRAIYPASLMTDKRDTKSHLIMSRTQIPLIQSWASKFIALRESRAHAAEARLTRPLHSDCSPRPGHEASTRYEYCYDTLLTS